MSFAHDGAPLTPILLDGDWSEDFVFFGKDTNSADTFPDGSTFSLTFEPAGVDRPAANDVIQLTSDDYLNQPATNQVGAAIPKASLASLGFKPGTYHAGLRRTGPGAVFDVLYLGEVPVFTGVSQLAESGGGLRLGKVAATGSAVQLFRDGDQVRIVRGEAAGAAAAAQAAAAAAAADRLIADNDVIIVEGSVAGVHNDRLQADNDVLLTGNDVITAAADAGAAHTDRLLADNDVIAAAGDAGAAHTDRLLADNDVIAADADASGAHADRLLADGDVTLAQNWASLVGAFVTGTLLSAREWAVGTFKRGVAGFGSAKDWATLLAATVDDVGLSAQEWAVGTWKRGLAGFGSAKDWASYMGGTVDDTSKSAKAYASDAAGDASATAADRVQTGLDRTATAASATAAATSAAGANVNDTAGAAAILERVATQDPAATLAQAAACVQRGVENRPAASSGGAYFRRGLVASSSLTAVASFTRATPAAGIDQSGNVFSVASGSPRVSTAGYLSEQGTTNNYLQSQAFDSGSWTKSNLTVTANAAVGPDGTTTADLVASNTATTAQKRIVQGTSLTGAQCVIYEVAPAGVNFVTVEHSSDVTAYATFDLVNGVVAAKGAPITAWIDRLANGFFRISTAFNAASAGTGWQLYLADSGTAGYSASSAAAVGAGIYLAQADCQPQGFPLSPIVTTTATVTRAADVAVETVNIPVGQAFTITGKLIAPSAAAASNGVAACGLGPTSGSDGLTLNLNGGLSAVLAAQTNGIAATPSLSVQAGLITGGAPVGFAISVSGNTLTWSVNGSAAVVVTLPGGAFPVALTKLGIACNSAGSQPLNSTLRELNIVMRALSAGELATASDVSLERDLDFTTQTYRYVGEPFTLATELPGTTFSGNGGNVKTVAGFYLAIASGKLRVSDAGLTVEPARTNLFLNSTAPVTQTITLAATGNYAISVVGTGSATVAAGTATITGAGAATSAAPLVINCTATGTITVTIAGAPTKVQVEAGAFATTPIDTAGASVTRNADVLTTLEASPASFSVQAEFTPSKSGSGDSPTVWCWSDGTASNRIELRYNAATLALTVNVVAAGVTTSLALGNVAVGTTYKVAAAFANNDIAASINGGAAVTSAATTIPAVSTFQFGAGPSGNQWGAGLRKVKRWRGRRTNAQLIADAA